ncbi:alpha/beta hydrolase [Aliiroseovarius lamellibrachiae]|uniref:alpha/beta hydrolase n=1 Tax=Aliiroseovarius lamellibrachiae TaxID=1924933 RepID=UPI001BE0A8B7|nr:alpha/beta hydrolase [Aliiroseovarius lamellibrachiae]MBT2129702.1 alpha/beta hydrolase [Aliiroseovarius lamellibrachiae]
MSRQLKWLNRLSRLAVKPFLRRMSGPKWARIQLDWGARLLFHPPPQTVAVWKETGGVPCLFVTNRAKTHSPRPGAVMLYIHGGGYVAGSPKTHKHLLARLARLTQLEVCAPDYRKAPEHPFPAAFEDTLAAYKGLFVHGYRPENIVIGGDSAGGGLALALLAHLNTQGVVPKAVFAFSPFTDATFSGASLVRNTDLDPMLPPERQDLITDWYLAGNPPADPRVSPIFAPWTSPLPPVFLQASEHEILTDDSVRMAEVLRAAGGHVTLDIWPDVPHVWVFFTRVLPEAKEALGRVAKFVNDQFVEPIDKR